MKGSLRAAKHLYRTMVPSWLTVAMALCGAFALVWFLVHVLPKPSRASYPCQRAAYPLASGFVIWLCGVLAIRSWAAWLGWCLPLRRTAIHWLAALTVVAMAGWTLISSPGDGGAASRATDWQFVPAEPNQPVGIARGIHPGRVVWAHDPQATRWAGNWKQNRDQWWLDANTDQVRVDAMLDATRQLTSAADTDNPGHLSRYLHCGKTWLNGRAVDASKTPFPKQLSLISIASTGPVRANQLARDRSFSGRSWQGDIAEILLYNLELSEADRQQVEKYLIRKYAIRTDAPGSNAPAVPKKTLQTSEYPGARPMAPADLPGKGLAQHPFFYAGEDKVQSMYIVKDGRIAWSHTMPATSKGEISDAVLQANGNILFAHQYGITEISPEKKVLWRLDAPRGCEIHTAQPLAGERVMYVQNGDPARLKVIDKATGKTELEFTLPVKSKGVHGQFRHARMIEKRTFLVAHMDSDKVAAYDGKGKVVWSVEIASPWSAARLSNGNTLIATNRKLVREVDRAGKTVWELSQADVPDYVLVGTQTAVRLANGNTLVNNWWNNWSGSVDLENPPVQALEVTKDKRVVWALRSWKPPAGLGPSTTIQLLDEPAPPEDLRLPELK